jgi:hypothetical protein
MDAYQKSTIDSERGANITMEKFSEKLFESFLSSPRSPSRGEHTYRGANYASLGYSRTARSAKALADLIRSGCVALYSAKRRVETFNLTGNPDEDKLWRAYVYVFNGGTCEPAMIYRFIRGENDDCGPPLKFTGVFVNMETLPAMWRVLTADESKLAGTRRPPGEPRTCDFAASGGSRKDLLDLDKVAIDASAAATLARHPGRRQARKSRRSAMEELGNHQSVGLKAAAISTISGAISGVIEAERQKKSEASSADANLWLKLKFMRSSLPRMKSCARAFPKRIVESWIARW